MYKLKIKNNIQNDEIKISINGIEILEDIIDVEENFTIKVETNNILDNDEHLNQEIKEATTSLFLSGKYESSEEFTPIYAAVEAEIFVNKDSELEINILKTIDVITFDLLLNGQPVKIKEGVSEKRNTKKYLLTILPIYILFSLMILSFIVIMITSLIENYGTLDEIIIQSIFTIVFLTIYVLGNIFFLKPLIGKNKKIDESEKLKLIKRKKRIQKFLKIATIIQISINIISIVLILLGYVIGVLVSVIVFAFKMILNSNLKDNKNENNKLDIISVIIFLLTFGALLISIIMYI